MLNAFNPGLSVPFFLGNRLRGFVVPGAVFLAVKGDEALHADKGHFDKGPIRRAWFLVVLPALMLHDAEQGALLLNRPASATNSFFLLVPFWGLYSIVALSAAATVIVSQAVISGVFSLTHRAVRLGMVCYCVDPSILAPPSDQSCIFRLDRLEGSRGWVGPFRHRIHSLRVHDDLEQ